MEELKINIDGIEHIAQMPKAIAWRRFIKFDSNKDNRKLDTFIDNAAELIASLFDDEVTADKVLENLDLDQIIPFYNKVFKWLLGIINNLAKKIPNADTPEA